MLSPLRSRVYRRLFAAQVIALVGAGLTTVALALLAYELAGGNAGQVLGTALALKMAAYVAIAPVVGGYAHLLPRKAQLVTLDLMRAGIVLLLPFVDAVWQVYALIFVLSACTAGFTPVFQATVPDILPGEEDYTRALSLSRLAYELENLLSPAAAAALLTVMSFHDLFLFNSAAFFASAALVISVGLPKAAEPGREPGLRHNLSYGSRIFLATPRLRGLLLLNMAVAAAGAMVIVNTVVYVRGYLGGSDSGVAIAMAAAGAGAMLAALLLPRVLERLSDRGVMLAGGLGLAIGLTLGLTRPGFAELLPLWFLLGIASSLVQAPAGRLLRRSCHAEDRPAVFATQFALSHACWLAAYPLAGWVAGQLGMMTAFGVLAVVVLASTATAAVLWPPADTDDLLHAHEPMDHAHLHVHDEHHRHAHEGWEGPEPHRHPHRHGRLVHRHRFIIDYHHRQWP